MFESQSEMKQTDETGSIFGQVASETANCFYGLMTNERRDPPRLSPYLSKAEIGNLKTRTAQRATNNLDRSNLIDALELTKFR